jgi:Ras-related protein Rab-5C
MYYRKAGAAIVMYELTSAHSFDRLRDWVRELADNGPPDIVVACVGNKADLVADDASRDVPRADAETFARDEHALYFETSARTGFGVNEVFTALAREVIGRRVSAGGRDEEPDADKVGDLGRDTRKAAPKGGCC